MWGDPPRRVVQSARLNNPLSRGQSLPCKHANVSRWGKPPSWGRVRVISNSGQIRFDGRFPSLKVKIESHITERLQQQKLQVRVEGHSPMFTYLATIQ